MATDLEAWVEARVCKIPMTVRDLSEDSESGVWTE